MKKNTNFSEVTLQKHEIYQEISAKEAEALGYVLELAKNGYGLSSNKTEALKLFGKLEKMQVVYFLKTKPSWSVRLTDKYKFLICQKN